MVIMITGASHVGKTILAQRMLEKTFWRSVNLTGNQTALYDREHAVRFGAVSI